MKKQRWRFTKFRESCLICGKNVDVRSKVRLAFSCCKKCF